MGDIVGASALRGGSVPQYDNEMVELPSSIADKLTQKPEINSIETSLLPIDPVDYTILASLADLEKDQVWPPTRFSNRNKVLRTLKRAWRGDISGFVEGNRRAVRVMDNSFKTAIRKITSLMLVSRIGQSTEVLNQLTLEHTVANSLIDQQSLGGSVLVAGLDENEQLYLKAIDPEYFYPFSTDAQEGYIIAVPEVSPESDSTEENPDWLNVIVAAEGKVVSRTYKYVEGSIGEQVEAEKELGPQMALIVPYLYTKDNWGTSEYETVLPYMLEMAIRMSSSSHILNAHEDPTLLIYNDKALEQSVLDRTQTKDKDEIQRLMTAYVRDVKDQDVAAVRLKQGNAKYLTWDGNIEGSLTYTMFLKESIQEMLGIPKALIDETPTSGVALKLQSVFFYAKTLSMIESTKMVVEMLLSGVSNSQITLEWPHYFDITETPPTEFSDA